MNVGGAYPASPPPSYESAVAETLLGSRPAVLVEPFVPPRYQSATEGRNSIRYSELPPLFDTTHLYLIDNKSADIASLNYQNNHSDFLTSVVHNSAYTPLQASSQSITLDDRSRWGGEFRTMLHMNMPNVNEFMFSNSFRVRVPSQADSSTGNVTEYEWYTLWLPEGNFSDMMTIDLMNNAIMENYLANGRQQGVREEDIGVKIDTRNMRLGWDPVTKLVMPGRYTNEAFHPDIILAPGCAIDFTYSRLSNLLGIRKRYPYQEGFVIEYEALVGGNIPALLDVEKYTATNSTVEPVKKDSRNRSYHVGEGSGTGATDTWYRSWYLAYNYGDAKGVRATTLLVTPDVTCGVEQVYWSLPQMATEPVTFRASQNPSDFPVVGAELLPLFPRSFYNAQSVYSQMLQDSANETFVFDRLPENAIYKRPPAPAIISISENMPAVTNHGTIGLKNNIPGVQRVTVTDARRRACPYVYKSLGIVTPRVMSSRTF
uniref:Penton protein n=1 Tax=Cardioderma bat adenovirus TaxID=3141913 RepID=A0AAU7E1A9_9ADEN